VRRAYDQVREVHRLVLVARPAHHGRRQQLDARFVPAFAGVDVLQTAHQAHVRLTAYQVLLADLPARVVDQPNCAAQNGRQVANEVTVKRIGVLGS
jgi:hypothetical protein